MTPTIRDLRVRRCFICHESQVFASRSDNRNNDWVHPCQCTLVAHQSCLLEMVDALPVKTQARCAQCNHSYVVECEDSLCLSILRLGNSIAMVSGQVIAVVGASALVLFTVERVLAGARIYSTFCLKSVFGNALFDTLLTDDVTNWSWSNRLFIPLIPLRALFFSQSLGIHHLMSMIMVFPSEPPRIVRDQIVQNALRIDDSSPFTATFSTPFDTFTPRWPPTRIQFAICMYFSHIAYDIVSTRTLRLGPFLPGHLGIFEDLISVFRQARARRRQREAQGDLQGEAQGDGLAEDEVPAEAQDNAPEDVVIQLRVDGQLEAAEVMLSTERSRISEALFLPLAARGMSQLIQQAAMHWHPAQRMLGIRPTASQIGIRLSSDMLTDINYWKRFTVWLWSDALDPVWLRTTLALGLVFVAKDCVHAVHLWLKKNEIASRRIKSRNFEGLDPHTLDLIRPIP